MEIKGKRALITGASGALGGAIAESLGAAGCDCVCHYNRDRGAADKVVRNICKAGQEAVAAGGDLSDEGQVSKVFDVCRDFGGVSILVNSAAVFEKTPLEDLEGEKIRDILAANVSGPMLAVKYFAGQLGEQEGVVVNLADVGGIMGWGQFSAYCASKGGVISITKCFAKELAPQVRVNAIAPGIVVWPGKMDAGDEQRQLSMIPAGRFGEPGDVTRAVRFLIENDYITGQVLNIDGGRCM